MRRSIIILTLLYISGLVGCAQPKFDPRFRARNKNPDDANWNAVLQKTEKKNFSPRARKMLDEIRLFLGAPHVMGGASPRGTDCSGFVMSVFKNALGVNLPHNAKMMYQHGVPIHIRNLKFGDLVFFEIYKGRGISHVGIYLIDTKFVHTSIYKGVTISDLRDKYYRQRYVGARRIIKTN